MAKEDNVHVMAQLRQLMVAKKAEKAERGISGHGEEKGLMSGDITYEDT